ncbi:MAG: ATP-dependent helicase, partial [Betaproteobacteria bacterium]
HIHADAIHGDKTQAERELALEAFKAGKTTVLVATDVASRGLDIDALPQVINFDIPHSPEDYVHRIGRTGRAGLEGEAISLVSPDDLESLSAIEKLIRKRIDRVLVPGFEPDGATIAALMGRDAAVPRREARPGGGEPAQAIAPRHAPRREPRTRDSAPVPASAPRQAPPPRPQRHADPIFSTPYEPSAPAPAEARPQAAGPPSRQRPRPVAALLGGMKRATG